MSNSASLEKPEPPKHAVTCLANRAFRDDDESFCTCRNADVAPSSSPLEPEEIALIPLDGIRWVDAHSEEGRQIVKKMEAEAAPRSELLSARAWLCGGGGGFEGGEDGIRACTMSAEWAIELMEGYLEYAESAAESSPASPLETPSQFCDVCRHRPCECFRVGPINGAEVEEAAESSPNCQKKGLELQIKKEKEDS